MNVAFRVDASSEIGLGHLIRCLALSEELIRRGHVCYFLSKIDSVELINRIVKSNVSYQKIKPNVSLQEDLDSSIKFSNENDIDWIITDSYCIDAKYIMEIKQNGFNVLSIDDTAQIHYYSDVVLNQNIGAEKLRFSTENYTKMLIGTKYIMIRDELLKRDKKIENNEVKKILVTFGGTDSDNFTLKILKLLSSINENVEFLIVLGPFNLFYKDIERYDREVGCKIKLIKSPEDMAEVYLESDIAISAGGSSCYELAHFGIPNIIIAVADNQIKVSHELDKQKVSIYLGKKNELKAERLTYNVKELIDNYSLRKQMRLNGRKLVDGKGKERIVEFMETYN